MNNDIVDLVSDDEYSSDFDYDTHDHDLYAFADEPESNRRCGEHIDLAGIDDIPDFDVPPGTPPDPQYAAAPVAIENQVVSEAACLQLILNVLPDISVEHVLALINETAHTPAACERIIAQLLDGAAYPKEQDEVESRKRKREREDEGDLEKVEANAATPSYHRDALDLLKNEFLTVPVRHLENVLRDNRTFLRSYGILKEQLLKYQSVANTFTKIKAPRVKCDMERILIDRGSTLPKELHTARKKEEKEAEKRRIAEAFERAEQENVREAQRKGEMSECLCCFDDFPINRTTSCNGDAVHLFCLPCAKKYVECEMGLGRVDLVCFADPDCGGTFTRTQLQVFLGEKSFGRLEHMQQQLDLAAAGLDFLSECPFCDFKAECLPVEVDKEFRCLNLKCRKVSCRLCQSVTHVPMSCEEFKKDSKLSIRHIVEEAMSAALIRNCNKCKHPFVKDTGCNKMTCSHCRNVQCYVCSKNVTDYNHFSDSHADATGIGGTRCPLHDNVEARHEQEVKKAADEAMAKARAEYPAISETDLIIKVSDRVKRAEENRQGQAQANHNGFPFHMAGGVLANGPVPHHHRPRPPVAVGERPRHVPPLPHHDNQFLQLRDLDAEAAPFPPNDDPFMHLRNLGAGAAPPQQDVDEGFYGYMANFAGYGPLPGMRQPLQAGPAPMPAFAPQNPYLDMNGNRLAFQPRNFRPAFPPILQQQLQQQQAQPPRPAAPPVRQPYPTRAHPDPNRDPRLGVDVRQYQRRR